MDFITTLFQDAEIYLHVQSVIGRVAWGLGLLTLLLLLVRVRQLNPRWQTSDWGVFLLLAAAAGGAVLFLGVRIPLQDAVPLKGQIGRQEFVAGMLLASLPILLTAGFLGPVSGALVGAASGLIYAFIQTHNPFTMLEFAFLGAVAGVMFHQPYRTRFFRWAASPISASIFLTLLYPIVFFFGVLLWLDDALSIRLDYAFRLLLPSWMAIGGGLLFGGVIAEPIARIWKKRWGWRGDLLPSPAEKSLETRSFMLMGLVVAGLALALSIVGWFAAYQSAYRLVEERASAAAELAAESVPSALEIGQNLIIHAATDERLLADDVDVLAAALGDLRESSLYFEEWIVFDTKGEVVLAGSEDHRGGTSLLQVEDAGAVLAAAGVPFQYYTSVQPEPEPGAILSFVVPLSDGGRVLIGRSDLGANPFTSPLLKSLGNLDAINGAGVLLDEDGTILYHPSSSMIGSSYTADIRQTDRFVDGTAPDTSRILVYAREAEDRAWKVVFEVPLQVVQQEALRIAGPLVGLLLALALASMILLRVILRVVTASLRNLSVEANQIAENARYLERPLETGGVDEVGVMRKAFERMRLSLKSRMDEQQQLLFASHGAASSLDIKAAVRPLLTAALTSGASSARVVLTGDAIPDSREGAAQTFGAGADTNPFSYLDLQVLELNKNNRPLIIQNPVAHRGLRFTADRPIPAAVLSVPLAQENAYFGVLWIAYGEAHQITEDEVRFMSTLGAQGALSVANARLFMGAEIGRERLGAILASTPDPVIVTDQNGALLLANTAACRVFGAQLETGSGQPVAALLEDETLIAMLTGSGDKSASSEIVAADKRVFMARATSVTFKNREIGTVCAMRDVTRFKELDKMKSEFVSHVSHDLKSPLLIMRGYATMVSLVGDVTDEQIAYIHKITHGVDRMAKIIDDLLHLGRFESGFNLELDLLSPTEIVANVVDDLMPIAQGKEIALRAAMENVVGVQVEGDRLFLERGLNNLVENAIKYTPNGGQVTVSAQLVSEQKAIRFSITDTGLGIEPGEQDRLFEKFFRTSNREARKQSGSGLGLAIVKSIVERHHGQVGVESVPGQGSRFTFTIPLKQDKSSK